MKHLDLSQLEALDQVEAQRNGAGSVAPAVPDVPSTQVSSEAQQIAQAMVHNVPAPTQGQETQLPIPEDNGQKIVLNEPAPLKVKVTSDKEFVPSDQQVAPKKTLKDLLMSDPARKQEVANMKLRERCMESGMPVDTNDYLAFISMIRDEIHRLYLSSKFGGVMFKKYRWATKKLVEDIDKKKVQIMEEVARSELEEEEEACQKFDENPPEESEPAQKSAEKEKPTPTTKKLSKRQISARKAAETRRKNKAKAAKK